MTVVVGLIGDIGNERSSVNGTISFLFKPTSRYFCTHNCLKAANTVHVFNLSFQVAEVKLCVSHSWRLSSWFKSTGFDGHDINRLKKKLLRFAD